MNKNTKRHISNAVLALLILAGILWISARFIHIGRVEYTDNAQVRQHITPVNTRVQGFIREIYFEEYQPVSAGDTLLVIEDAEYLLRVAQAEADYQNAIAGREAAKTALSTADANIRVTESAIEEARVCLENARTDYGRYEELLAKDAVTRQQYDRAKTDYEAAQARYQQLLRQKESVVSLKREQGRRLEQSDAGVKLAEAALNLARLNLSYTVITATADGVTGRKNIHEGELVQPGQAMVVIVDASSKWVIANYKETQTTHMEKGQPVEIEVDAVPGVRFAGKIASISDATGASFSLVPQDNSAGNFVKVEQRIPVRIEFTSENSAEDLARLRSGMNVECTVRY